MTNKLYRHSDKDASGKYTNAIKCDCCGKPTNEAERYSDDEVCGSSDGPGFYLCHRKRCATKRDAMTLAERTGHYCTQRAKNNAA